MDNRSFFRKIKDWIISGGVCKNIGRVVTLLGLIAALVITGIGVADMNREADAAYEAAYQKEYTAQQKREYERKKKENDKEIAEGREAKHELPETMEEYVPEKLPTTKRSLEKHVGPFVTGYVLPAAAVLIAAAILGWAIGCIPQWTKAMQKAGVIRVMAGAFLWAGLLTAVVLVVLGVIRIVQVDKSTLPEVGRILLDGYVFWAVIAAGTGFFLHWMLLHSRRTQEEAFEGVGAKVRRWGRCLFYVALTGFAALAITAVCMLVLARWMNVLWFAIAAVVTLAAGWCLSLVLEALGTCTMIMEPQAKEAEARAYERRHAEFWTCPRCGESNIRYQVSCSACGETKPVQE